MKFIFDVDQREAIRRGIDTGSTIKLDLDVPRLNQNCRTFLADRFHRGQIKSRPLVKDPELTAAAQDRAWDKLENLRLPQPDVQGLIEATGRLDPDQPIGHYNWLDGHITHEMNELAFQKKHNIGPF